MRNNDIRDNKGPAVNAIASRLPSDWQTTFRRAPAQRGGCPDYIIEARGPDGETAMFVVELKTSLDPKDVPAVVDQLRHYIESLGKMAIPIIEVPYLGTRTRERLKAAGVGYADLTGNVLVISSKPAIFIETHGAERNPGGKGRPARTLKGAKAGRIVRALCDLRPPLGVRKLGEQTGIDPGYVSRVLDLLAREDLVKREPRGPVLEADWEGLIRRWVEDYSVTDSKCLLAYIDPRGIGPFLKRLATVDLRYAVTGSAGAAAVAPVAPIRLVICYVDDLDAAAERLALRRSETGANVMLAAPFDPVIFDRTWKSNGICYAAYSQIAADLLTSPGRGPSEGEEFIRWMKENELAWRA